LHSISYSAAHDDIYTSTAAGTAVGGGQWAPSQRAVPACPRLDYQFQTLVASHWSILKMD
jgi:hypothetical protein